MDQLPLWQRLKQRKLVTWTAAYVTTAAALFGTLETVGDVFGWPDPLLRAVFFLLVAGLVATVTLAWFHGERGRQRVTAGEGLLLTAAAVFGLGAAAASLVGSDPVDGEASAKARVVVQPFADHSPGSDQAYLAFGVAEEIRQALSRRLGAPVARGAGDGIAGAAVLEGGVQRIGDAIHLTTRLADAAGRELWSDRAEVPIDELFEAEERIVGEVAHHLGSRERDGGPPGRREIRDPQAHDAYLRGEHALRQRTPAAVIQAIAQYRAASDASPGMAAALAREAYAYALFLDWGWTYPGLPEEALLQRAEDLSDQALRLDSLSAEGWLARAYLTYLAAPERPERALPPFARAVDLDPANPEAHHQHGQLLMVLGRYPEAKAAYHAALAIEAERPMTLVPLAAIAERERDTVAAGRWADSAIALARGISYPWAYRALLRLNRGASAGARADAEKALEIDPAYDLPARSMLAAALWTSGETSRAEEELERARRAMVRPDRPSPTEVYYLSVALLRMERPGEALDLIEAARPRSPWLWFYLQSPPYDEVREESRFRAVVEASDARPRAPEVPER